MAHAVFNKHAEAYAEKFWDVGLYADSLNDFCNLLPKEKSTVLEMACGPGNITRDLINRRKDLQILATDISENMLKVAREKVPEAEFKLLDCNALDTVSQKYDAVVCGFGFPYLSKADAIRFIENARKIILPEGLLYISTMEDDYEKSSFRKSSSGEDGLYMHYHELAYLKEAFEKNGFRLLKTYRNKHPSEQNPTANDLVVIGKRIV